MNLKFKTGLIASLGAAAFTPLLACACSQSNTKTVTERTLKLVYIDGYYEDVETYMVNNDKTICYITLPELLRIGMPWSDSKLSTVCFQYFNVRFFLIFTRNSALSRKTATNLFNESSSSSVR